MTTIANVSTPSPISFEVLLDKMMPHFRYYAKRASRYRNNEFEDVVQDLVGMALEMYHSLVRRGKEIFYTPIMKFAIKRYREGRRFTGMNSTDLFGENTQRLGRSETCQLSIFEDCEDDLDIRSFMEDRKTDVFKTAQLRMDFSDWYEQQSVRNQWIISDLAMSHSTGDVAKKYGVSPALISILRKNFALSWRDFIDPPEAGMLVPA